MISQKYIKLLDFNIIEDVFMYIVDSYKNGSISQSKELINKLSEKQFKDFLDFLQEFNINNEIYLRFRVGL